MTTNFYNVIITPTAYREISRIYEYITEDLCAENAAKRIMKKVEEEIQKLKYTPRMHQRIKKIDDLKRTYRRIVIKNYVLLYTIDEETRTVFISHMYYGGKNYIDNKF